jgi:hypothetical protein
MRKLRWTYANIAYNNNEEEHWEEPIPHGPLAEVSEVCLSISAASDRAN